MDIWVLNKNYESIGVVDLYSAFIWTDRYQKCGDFELHVPASKEIVALVMQDLYLSIDDSDRLMIVEEVKVTTTRKNDTKITFVGRSLESILARRIIWDKVVIDGNLQDGIKRLLDENVISPTDPSRKIPNFVFKFSSDSRVTSLTANTQFWGENLYDSIMSLCKDNDLGFRVLPQGKGGFEFELYFGIDRSYDQDVIPWVVFSPEYDNLAKSNSVESKAAVRNAALVLGEKYEKKDEGGNITESGQYMAEAKLGSPSGLDRREALVSATNVSKKLEDDTEMTDAEYEEQLTSKGSEALSDTKMTKAIDGEISAVMQFVYGKDFFLGDQVEVVNHFGDEETVRVIEVIRSDDRGGYKVTPTFTYGD